jgi:5'(3')-deoxyribonucleotidase
VQIDLQAMSLVELHLEKARANRVLAVSLEQPLADDPAWCCVVMFYSAVHLMQAYLIGKANIDFRVEDHHARQRAMDKCPELDRMLGVRQRAYRQLKELSEQVRYDPAFICRSADHDEAKKNLNRVFSALEPLIAP